MKNYWIKKSRQKSDCTSLQELANGDFSLDLYYDWQYTMNEEVAFDSLFTSNFVVYKYGRLEKHHVLLKSVIGSYNDQVFQDDGKGNLNLEDGTNLGRIDYETGIIRIPMRNRGEMVVSYEWNWAENGER